MTGREALAVAVFVVVTIRRRYKKALKERYMLGWIDGEQFARDLRDLNTPTAPVVRMRPVKPDDAS